MGGFSSDSVHENLAVLESIRSPKTPTLQESPLFEKADSFAGLRPARFVPWASAACLACPRGARGGASAFRPGSCGGGLGVPGLRLSPQFGQGAGSSPASEARFPGRLLRVSALRLSLPGFFAWGLPLPSGAASCAALPQHSFCRPPALPLSYAGVFPAARLPPRGLWACFHLTKRP